MQEHTHTAGGRTGAKRKANTHDGLTTKTENVGLTVCDDWIFIRYF